MSDRIEAYVSADTIAEHPDTPIKRLVWLALQGDGAPLSNVFGYQISCGSVTWDEPDSSGGVKCRWVR